MDWSRVGGIYARISVDDERDGKGVRRQENICRGMAKSRSITVARVFLDNDLSGSGKQRRPDYEELVAAIRSGELDTILVTEIDRLQRGLREYVDFYDACEERRVLVVWDGGWADFATGDGVDALEDRATDARKELRKIRRRVRAKHAELLEEGVYTGPKRTFGFDHGQVVPEEAELIREAAARILAGERLRTIARDWADRGVVGLQGKVMRAQTIKGALVAGRMSGRRDFGELPDGRRMPIPKIVRDIPGAPQILDPETHDAVRAMLAGSDAPRERTRYVLGTLCKCGRCGKPLRHSKLAQTHGWAGRRTLVCRSGLDFQGCGRLSIMAEPVEALVEGAVVAVIDGGGLKRAMHDEDGDDAQAGLDAIDEKLSELAAAWAEDRLGREEWQRARETLLARRDRYQEQVDRKRRALRIEHLPDPLSESWDKISSDRKRAIIEAVVEEVIIHPASHRGARFEEDRIEVRWCG